MPTRPYRRTKLPNGTTLVTEQIPYVRSATVGVLLDCGSRDEAPEQEGLCHFLEHMLFKGTKIRTAQAITHEIESKGGMINAETSREYTMFYTRSLEDNFASCLDVLLDLVTNPALEPKALEREKKVVFEEMDEVVSNPSDWIGDLFMEAYFEGHELSHPVLGRKKTLADLSRTKVDKFYRSCYVPERTIIACVSRLPHECVIEEVSRRLPAIAGTGRRERTPFAGPQRKVVVLPHVSEQLNLILGMPGLPYGHRDRFNLLAASARLGEGMSSILFQKLREDRGLVYSVASFTESMTDCGMFGISLQVAPKNLPKALSLIAEELGRLAKEELPEEVLLNTQAQMKGNLVLALEHTGARMNRLARQQLYMGRFVDVDKIIELVDAITTARIKQTLHKLIRPEQVVLCGLGAFTPAAKKAAERFPEDLAAAL